ncbi:SIMPL domain-containing protein [Kovacikia minuta CCNUW1]|uniref:SIMPL domain-containing protein n=1 Tax=Kovacikia minuta TaxID=2931930 RepID=UPI001CCDEAC6|nr:SIMPL domain-containing protein [Kovacikia minuta]UBF25402.1 SIMPL domain-containing protein [Kovacikia minuta CCNUW1]
MNSSIVIKQASATRTPRYWHRFRAIALSTGLLTLTLTNPVLAQEKMLRTLTATGRGTELVATTLTQVRLGVETQGKTANEVQQEVASRSNSVVSLLKSRNVERLETTGINLSPTYRYDNNVQTLTGYTASNIVSFRVETQKAGTLLDEAVKAGASRIDGVSFIASDAAIANAQKSALRKATQDAEAQAEVVLNALGLTRREVVSIQINGASAPPPRPLPMEAADARIAFAKAPTPVIGGEQQVEAAVTLQISY